MGCGGGLDGAREGRWNRHALQEQDMAVNCHITLNYARPPNPTTWATRVAAARARLQRPKCKEFVATAVFSHEDLATPTYAWIDLLVTCPLYAFCHQLASILCEDEWRRPCFHASFATWED